MFTVIKKLNKIIKNNKKYKVNCVLGSQAYIWRPIFLNATQE